MVRVKLFNTLIYLFYRGINQNVQDLNSRRRTKKVRLQRIDDGNFEELVKGHDNLHFEGKDHLHHFPIFNLLGNPCLLRIFLRFVTPDLVKIILQNLDPSNLAMDKSRGLYLKPTTDMYYETLAISIRIQGLQNRPIWNKENKRPLRDAVIEARDHFKETFPRVEPLAINKALKLMACALIKKEYFEELSNNFQSLVRSLGEYVAGDEKLLHFTGNSGDIRLVLSKPDRVGLWFYELAMPLSNGRSYMLYIRLHSANKAVGESIPCSEVVKSWANVVQRLGDPNTLIVFDSYYLDATGRRYLVENNVKFVAAVTKERFANIFDKLKDKVERPGDWAGIHNPITRESAVYYWDKDENISKKLVISNALTKTTSRNCNENIPIYDIYQVTFKSCDIFNKSLHDRTWPHRHGGHSRCGDSGLQHNFALSCILQNVFNCYLDYHKIDPKTRNFVDMCIELSDAIYQYANA